MKLTLSILLVFALLTAAPAQTGPTAPSLPAPAAAHASTAILDYIQTTWTTLTRSTTECGSLADVKVTAAPVLYLPAELPTPPAVLAMEQKCKVNVLHLPHAIQKI